MGFEIPVIRENKSSSPVQNFIDKAEEYFNAGDNKAAGVYLRSAFEFLLKRYCLKKKVPVNFEIDLSKLKTDVLWKSLVAYNQQPIPLKLFTALDSCFFNEIITDSLGIII